MELQKMQEEVHDWISQYGGYWPPLSLMARFTEETGELARELNHVYGMKKKKPEEKINSIEGELGDLLITMICIANSLNINLENTFVKTMGKVDQRDKDRTKETNKL